jgi:hypothetical protein
MLSSYPALAFPKRNRNRRNDFSLRNDLLMKTHGRCRTRRNAFVVMLIVLLCGNWTNVRAEQEPKQAVTIVVICEDAAAKKTIREALLTHIRTLQDLEVVDRNGFSSLIVYAQKTLNDPKNPNGYAIAIAHTNCYELKLAYQNLRGINDEKVRAVRTVAERALRNDTGILRHLNVAHLDELSGQKLDDFAKRVVADFHERQKEMD